MPYGFSAETGTRVTTNRTQWPPSGSTTRTCPSRSRSTSRVGSRGSVTVYSYHTEATQASGVGPAEMADGGEGIKFLEENVFTAIAISARGFDGSSWITA